MVQAVFHSSFATMVMGKAEDDQIRVKLVVFITNCLQYLSLASTFTSDFELLPTKNFFYRTQKTVRKTPKHIPVAKRLLCEPK